MLTSTVILADGTFPVQEVPLRILREAKRIICCDGAASSLLSAGLEPLAIVGDCDSIDKDLLAAYKDIIYADTDQETNDLTKAVNWCLERGFLKLIILGATGKREDHTIGNISLLLEYARRADVKMYTETGYFIPFVNSCTVSTYRGQQVSIFSPDPATEITSEGLLYPLRKRKIRNWWEATLNEATGESFRLEFKKGGVLVFMKY